MSWCQFHQHFCRYPFAKNYQSQTFHFSFVIFGAKILAKKCARKMLMKLTLGLNFINVIRARFSYECRYGGFF